MYQQSQVGCTLTCSFCHTGTQKLVRNLTAGEIVGQILLARDDLGEWPEQGRNPKDETRLLSNVVLMGMGEPLKNTNHFENVRDAMRIAMDPRDQRCRADVSRCRPRAWCPRSRERRTEIGCLLAVSLPRDDVTTVRDRLVPINKKLEHRGAAGCVAQTIPRLSNSERITFEYVMLKGVNDSDADAAPAGQVARRGYPPR